jgi:replicative DNA helicase
MKEEQKNQRSTNKKEKLKDEYDYGTANPPPFDNDLEQAVLGAILIESKAMSEVAEILTPSSFYKEENKLIYDAAFSLFKRNYPIDIITVTAELKKSGKLKEVGGAYYVASLTQAVGSSVNIVFHSRILAELHIKREVIRISHEIQRDAVNDTEDVFDTIDKLQQRGHELANIGVKKDVTPASGIVTSVLDSILKRMDEEVPTLSGVPSGFYDIDRITGGWQKTDMIIVAARPSMGKTAFVIKNAINAAIQYNRPCAIFSLEMSASQIIMRMLSIVSGVPGDVIKGKPTQQQFILIQNAASQIISAPIYIDDTPSISIFEFRSKARRMKEVYNIEEIVIDYVQLMTPGTSAKNIGTREQEISHISRQIKGTAKELDIPIIALSQLSRAVEKRENKKPLMSDLRESGSLEQDADIVAFLYREDYYSKDAVNEEGNSIEGVAELIIAKHRNGAVGDVPLLFDKATTNFTGTIPNMYMASGAFREKKITPNADAPTSFDVFDNPETFKKTDDTPF